MLAIIGGTGLANLANLEIRHRQVIRTPYGEASGAVTFGDIAQHPVMFLARHGYGHSIPPHQVNYRANMWALHAQGATHVVSVASVGGITPDLVPGTIVIPDQIIDYTHGRKNTYFDNSEVPVTHTDFTFPYSQDMRELCMEGARRAKEPFIDGGVYGAVQGPRLETAAEINRMERDGATMVGMTGMPEAILARELELHYAAIAVVINQAAGRGESSNGVDYSAINQTVQGVMDRVRAMIEQIVLLYHD